MARNERYITTVELNSQQAMDRLKELEKKVQDLKKAKEDAAKSGGFFDEKQLTKATKELNQWRAQMTGVQGILDNINDVTLQDLQKGLRKLKEQSKTALPGTQEFEDIQSGIIKELADKESCVIVGRCADYILKDRDDVLKVFVHADIEKRAKRIVEVYGETAEKPLKRLKDKDKQRRAYYQIYTEIEWGDARNYEVCLDSGELGIDTCVQILKTIVKGTE